MSSDINFLNIPVSPLSVNVQTSNLLVPTQQSSNAIASYAIRTDQTITINGGGDLDGNPLLPYDDALIYAAKGFTFNNVPILPVNRTTSGNPIFDPLTGKQVLVDNAVTVASGYTTINANNNPYIGLLPPKVVSPETITIPSYNDTKTQELNARTPLGASTITFKASSNPINNTNDWNNKFPPPGTSTNPKVVRVTGGGLNIPNGVNLSNYIITVDSGDINFNGNGNILDNVVLVTSNGNINLGKVQSNNLSVFASGAINMNSQARFGGKTLIANNSNNITFDGATKTATNADTIQVISQGNITFNGASNTRGDFLSKGTFIANGKAFIFGSINAKQNIIFNGGAYVTAVSSNSAPTNISLSNNTTPENVSANTLIGNFTSTDPDTTAQTFAYSLVTGTGSTDNASFVIINNKLHIINSPDFEAKNSYSIRVRTTDQGGLTYEKVFNVSIANVNEVPTTLVLSNNTTPENVAANSLIGNFTSSDPDSGNTFTYRLVNGTGSSDNASFKIANNELRIVNSPDFEAKNSYSIRVRTTDQSGLSFEKVFTVNITNVNEAPTTLVLSNNTTPENVVANSLIGKFTSSDPDKTPQTFTYSLTAGTGSTDNTSFSIVNNELHINTSPDFETKSTYSIRVRTTDQGGLSFEKVFSVRIIDLYEPIITLDLSNNSTPENVPENTLVGRFSSTLNCDPSDDETHDDGKIYGHSKSNEDSSECDEDENDSCISFTYSLVSGTGSTDNASFSIINNELHIINSPDFETKNIYNIRVRTTNQGGLSFEKTFTVNITNVNEAPIALVLNNNTTPENVVANSLIGTFASTDPDTTAQTFTYSLVTGTGSTDNTSFSIINNELRIVNSPDFEAKNSYSIRVRTTDQEGLSYEKVFIVNITDVNEAPTALILSNNTTSENVVANSLIGNFTSADPDSGNTFSYSLVNGTGSTDNAYFSIDNNELRIVNSPDFEAKNSYSIRVRTTDQGGLSFEKLFTVSITDVNEAPTALVLSNNTTPENISANSLIGTFTSTDPDTTAQTFTYSLVTGTGSTDNASFAIINNELRIVNSPDFEAKNSYSIRVKTTDQGGLSFEKVFTVGITDVIEAPIALVLSNNTTPENVVANSLIGTFTSTDPDTTPQTFSYSLVTGTGSTDNAAFTVINNELRIVNSPNFEAKNSYSIRVRTTDQGGLSYEKIFTVGITDVNEAPTALVLSNNITLENVVANSLIGNFSSTDPDTTAQTFTYSLVTGTGSTDNAAFLITNNELRIVNSPDFETKNSYSIRVRTTDQGGLSFEKIFTVNISNVNEAPVLTIIENQTIAVGTLLSLSAIATDPDQPTNLTYSLEPNAPEGASINPITGIFTWTPTVSQAGIYTIGIRVTDDGNPSLSNLKTFQTVVFNPNLAPTDLALSPRSIAENVTVNTEVGSFSSVDPDTGNSFTYSLVQAG